MIEAIGLRLAGYPDIPAADLRLVNGRIYGIPNMQQWARSAGFLFNAKYYEEYDGESVENLTDLADYIICVSKGEAEKGNQWEYQASKANWLYDLCQTCGWKIIGGKAIPGLADATAQHPEVFNEYLTDEFKAIIEAKAKLYQHSQAWYLLPTNRRDMRGHGSGARMQKPPHCPESTMIPANALPRLPIVRQW